MTQKQLICACMVGSDKVAECLGDCKDYVYAFCTKQFEAAKAKAKANAASESRF